MRKFIEKFGFLFVYLGIILGIAWLGLFASGNGRAMAVGQTQCPTSAGWTKIDSNDLSTYPVAGATAYCFKAGSDNSEGCTGGLFDAIPVGGFVQPYCGLSHWAYYIGTTPTPTLTPTPTPECTEDCEVTPTPTATPSATPSPTPVVNNGGPGDGLSDGRSDGRSSCPECTQAPKSDPVTFAATGSAPDGTTVALAAFGVICILAGIGMYIWSKK